MNYERLGELLKARHISRRKLALASGISPETLTSAFHNNTQTGIINSLENIKQFAAILGVPYHVLLTKEEVSNMEIFDDEGKKINLIAASKNDFEYPVRMQLESILDKMNVLGQKKLLEYATDLVLIPRYQKPPQINSVQTSEDN